MYEFKNEAERAEFFLYGAIGETWWGEGNSAKTFAEDLRSVRDKDVDIHIDSGGGDVFEGFAMASAIQRHPGRVTAYIDGLAASAASYVAVVCDEVKMNDYAWMMIHRASSWTSGNASDLEQMANRLREIDKTLVAIYEKRTALTFDEIVEAMEAETWYSAQDALDAGFATEVLDTDERLAACLGANLEESIAATYKHAPIEVMGCFGHKSTPVPVADEDTRPTEEAPAEDVGHFVIDGRVYNRTKEA